MSVNMRFGIDQKKTKRYGKIFHTIDFELNSKYRDTDYIDKSNTIPCGEFVIDGKRFKVTISELERILETANSGMELLRKSYKLGALTPR